VTEDAPLVTDHGQVRAPQGRIYDLGYQRYTGPRQGRGRALMALFRFSLRRAWAIGRPFRSKIIPWGLLVIALIPALIALGIAALVSEGFSPIHYENYYELISILILLFCTSVAPELVCPDQRQRVVTLYFSRALSRPDYVLAKLGALLAALLAMALLPQAILFAGNALASKDSLHYVRDNLDKVPRILAAALLVSLYFGSISLAIAAHTTRRIFAAGAFIAAMLISTAVMGSVHATLNNDLSRHLALLALSDVPIAATHWIFDSSDTGGALAATVDLPQELWMLAATGYTVLALLALTLRYRRLVP
jgi:ABC-2 type transport system permease protein